MKMRTKYIIGLLIFLAVLTPGACVLENLGPVTPPAVFGQWHQLQAGLNYIDISLAFENDVERDFLVVKIDPKLFEFRIFQNENADSALSLEQIQKQNNAVTVFNGAFFDENFKAMGMLQDSRATLHKKSSNQLMNGIFSIPNGGPPKIFSLQNVPVDATAFMIQNGPILLNAAGKIQVSTDTQKLAARTALGVDKDGNVILVVLHQDLLNADNILSLYRFAHFLKEQDFFVKMGLHDVLNLDGGVSTGAIIDNKYLPELSPVQNAVFVLPRTAKI